MLMMIKAGIKRLLAGPATKQYRVTYGGDDVYRLEGWYVEMRGAGIGWFWTEAHHFHFDTELEAIRNARQWAKRDNGVFIE